MIQRQKFIKAIAVAALLVASGVASAQSAISLLNVSYDPTRELYVEYNTAFAKF